MKLKLTAVTLLFVGIAIVLLIYVRFPQSGKVDAQKISAAAQTYTRELKRQGRAIPESVNLKELIARGLLQTSDATGFAGSEVTVSLTANLNDPNAVLMIARFPDGQELLAMGDGSIQVKQIKL